MLGDVGDQSAGEVARTAHAHLRLGRRREERRNGVTKAPQSQIHFAQPVEKKEARPDGIVLKLARHKFERREGGDFEQSAAEPTSAQQLPAPLRFQRGTLRFGEENLLNNRAKLLRPTSERVGVPRRKLRKRCHRALQVRPPFQRASIALQHRDVQFRLEIAHAMPLELEVAEPRHPGDGAVKERMRMMREARQSWILHRAQSAAGLGRSIQRERPQAQPCQIGLRDERIVAGAEEEDVVGHVEVFMFLTLPPSLHPSHFFPMRTTEVDDIAADHFGLGGDAG